jgi:pimeloyl-ACP methyl ester carboxylesterase
MPYADSQGVRIHYEVEGQGPPLVLHHGFTDSLQDWYEAGYVDALKPHYRLILIDARGHGASDKPHNPEAYEPERNAADVVSVLTDHLGVFRVHFFGYSMGGYIAFAMAQYAPDRVRSLIIGGANPQARVAPDPTLEALRQGMEAFVARRDAPTSPALKARLLANDVQALMANRIHRLACPGFTTIFSRMTMPCLVYAGEADPAYPVTKEFVVQMPNAAFFSLPALGHADAFFRSDLVLPHVTRFLASVKR